MYDSIYKDSEHFRKETKLQSKFFTSLKLNSYRKSVALRYGYKGISLFEDSLDLLYIKRAFFLMLKSSIDNGDLVEYIKETTSVDVCSVSDICKAIDYVFSNDIDVKLIHSAFDITDIQGAIFQSQEDEYLSASNYKHISLMNLKKQTIVKWFIGALTMVEISTLPNNCSISEVLNDLWGAEMSRCIPTELHRYRMAESVFIDYKNKCSDNKPSTYLLSELIVKILCY